MLGHHNNKGLSPMHYWILPSAAVVQRKGWEESGEPVASIVCEPIVGEVQGYPRLFEQLAIIEFFSN